MVCIFCLKETSDGISIYGESNVAESARKIIAKYFWFELNEINAVSSYTCSECWMKVESFHEFYRTIELIHKKRPYNDDDDINDAEQFNPLFDCNANDEPEYKTILIPTPIVVVERLPIIFENKNDEITTANDNIPQDDACEQEESSPIPETKKISKKCRARGPKGGKKSKLKSAKSSEKNHTKKTAKTVRRRRKIVCYMCHKQFKSMRTVRDHYDLHDPIESLTFECNLCDRKFSRELKLKNHILLHALRKKKGEKARELTKCPQCQKSLTNGSLYMHMKLLHSGDKTKEKFVCDECGKECNDPSAFRQHVATHADRELTQVQCQTCGKWLKNQYTLRAHKMLHEKIQYKCPHCDKFKPLSQLRQHIAIAHSEPTHKCHLCDKSFTREKALREHIATHTGVSLYRCVYCKQRFKNDANMYKHLRTNHLEQWNLDRAKN